MKYVLLLLLPLNLWAASPGPQPPSDWVEMNSLAPVILTWVYGDPTKKLMDVPSFTIQKYPRDGKFVTFIEKNSPDQNSCSLIKAEKVSDWNQLWCLRPNSVVNLMWKGTPVNEEIKATLLKWVLTHE